ncbi:MAG: 50S ribosomal protein L19 [Actinobacteria bacterium]|uniref:Unannotated protein n=1 Tax=freshwater metagenome TaxID=449393 RepID=A0A6J5ZWX0_9ZZZZ|nr:50S ribosomal protein L19 [Actinomycetota bacterium]
MSTVIDNLERAQLRRVPEFNPGDRVKVHFQVVEGERRRTQVFEGIVISRQGNGARETFIVRKQSFGVGVERTFPLHSPKIEKIEVTSRGDVRRAKLYYLRDRVGKGARVRERGYFGPEEEIAPGLVHAAEVEVETETAGDQSDEVAVLAENETDDSAEAAEQPAADEAPKAEEAPEVDASADVAPDAEDAAQPEGDASPAAEEDAQPAEDGSESSSSDAA